MLWAVTDDWSSLDELVTCMTWTLQETRTDSRKQVRRPKTRPSPLVSARSDWV